jgi:hypothetical protein
MVKEPIVHIVMPVKDSIETTEQAIRAIVSSGHTLTVYDDNSTPENAARLDALQNELGIGVIHIGQHTDHPSPNYRWLLIEAQKEVLRQGGHLIIVESDVIVQKETIRKMVEAVRPNVGMIAAVTTDRFGFINFPYEYARVWKHDAPCRKRFSFCCTLLSHELLCTYPFEQLDPSKNWYDVHISHVSLQRGFENILQISNPVVHIPHSSRPWKKLKYTHPLRYYWNKLIHGRDKI